VLRNGDPSFPDAPPREWVGAVDPWELPSNGPRVIQSDLLNGSSTAIGVCMQDRTDEKFTYPTWICPFYLGLDCPRENILLPSIHVDYRFKFGEYVKSSAQTDSQKFPFLRPLKIPATTVYLLYKSDSGVQMM